MNQPITRRNFVAAAGLGALAGPSMALAQAPQVLTKRGAKPVVIASDNGQKSKDANGLKACYTVCVRAACIGFDVAPRSVSPLAARLFYHTAPARSMSSLLLVNRS